MVFPTPKTMLEDPTTKVFIVGAVLTVFLAFVLIINSQSKSEDKDNSPGTFTSFLRFFYGCFLKPHTGDGTGNGQQDALESFYKAQAGVYDATRKRLLCGREDMLGLVAAQLKEKSATNEKRKKPIWVDVSGQDSHFQAVILSDVADRWWNRLQY